MVSNLFPWLRYASKKVMLNYLRAVIVIPGRIFFWGATARLLVRSCFLGGEMKTRTRVASVVAIFLVSALVGLRLFVLISPYPGIVPDELVYMRGSFFGNDSLGNANPLFSLLYSTAQGCGDAWYQCAKSINFVFDLLFAGVLGASVFLATRKILISAVTFVGIWLAPLSAYGAYFMPESMFYFLVALFFVLLTVLWNRPILGGLLSGLALGLAMLTKPHAFFIFLGLLLFGLIFFAFQKFLNSTVSLRPLFIALASGLLIRSIGGFLAGGAAGLNPLSGYFGTGSIEALLGGASGEVSGNGPFERLPYALLSAGTNLAAGILVVAFILLAHQLLTGQGLKTTLSSRPVLLALGILASLVLMTAAFGAYLELRGSEATAFRAMTRYWQFSIAIVLAALVPQALKANSASKSRVPKGLLATFLLSGVTVFIIPREQTLTDSSLFWGEIWIPILSMGVFMAIVMLARARVVSAFATASAIVIGFALFGSLGSVRYFDFSSFEKSGAAAGTFLKEALVQNPADAGRVTFVGERVEADTAAFMAKLESHQMVYANFYSATPYNELEGSPRWVVASKEVFISGNPVSREVFGDVVVYEFGIPPRLKPIEFGKFGVLFEGAFRDTYWGSWVIGTTFSFTVPEAYLGDTLEIGLLVNDELTDRRVSIDFGEGPIEGELLADQVITPVTLTAPNNGSWAGRLVTVSYLGQSSSIGSSDKGVGLGTDGFSVFQGR